MCMKMLNNLGKKLGGKFPLTTLGYSMVKSWSKLLATFSFTFAQRSCQVPFDFWQVRALGFYSIKFVRQQNYCKFHRANCRSILQHYTIPLQSSRQTNIPVPFIHLGERTFIFLSYTPPPKLDPPCTLHPKCIRVGPGSLLNAKVATFLSWLYRHIRKTGYIRPIHHLVLPVHILGSILQGTLALCGGWRIWLNPCRFPSRRQL